MHRVLVLFILILWSMTACSQAKQEDSDPTLKMSTHTRAPLLSQISADGQTLYTAYCADCHGLNGEGENPADPFGGDLAPPHDATGHTWHHDDDLLIEIVTAGGISNRMPAFGEQLTPEQIELVLAHIKTLWTDDQRAYQAEITRTVRGQ